MAQGGEGGADSSLGGAGEEQPSAGDGGSYQEPEIDETPPSVLEISPEDGAEDVERDVAITIRLSEPIEPTRVPSAIEVRGPEGPIPGEISLAEDTVTFVPDEPLVLLGTYRVTVRDTLADFAGNTLEEPMESAFRARDGEWGEPVETHPSGKAGTLTWTAVNGRHDVLLLGNDTASPPAVWSAVHHATSREWADPQTHPGDQVLTAHVRAAALGDDGAASVVWWFGSSSSQVAWSRYTQEAGWSEATPIDAPLAVLTAVTADRRIALITQDSARSVSFITHHLATSSSEPAIDLGDRDETLHSLFAVRDDLVLVSTRPVGAAYVLSVARHNVADGWRDPDVLVESADEPLDVIAGADELGNLAVLWTEDHALWARVYSATMGKWQKSRHIATGTRWRHLALSNGFFAATYESEGGLSLAYHHRSEGWLEDAETTFGSTDVSALAVDVRGNVLVIWNSNGNHRRYIAGEGWQSLVPGDFTFALTHLGAFPDKDGAITLFATDTSGAAPKVVAVRYE